MAAQVGAGLGKEIECGGSRHSRRITIAGLGFPETDTWGRVRVGVQWSGRSET